VRAGGITYIPIPAGGGSDYTGLLIVEPPAGVGQDQVFEVAVRQVTKTSADVTVPGVIGNAAGARGGRKMAARGRPWRQQREVTRLACSNGGA
jgi:hypothetical protein